MTHVQTFSMKVIEIRCFFFQEGELLTGPEAKKIIGAPGERVNNPHLKNYTVFIQNGGAGTRFLKAGSLLLYKLP